MGVGGGRQVGICLTGNLGNAEDILVGATGEEGCYRYLARRARDGDAAQHPATQGTILLLPPRTHNKECARGKCRSTYVARPRGQGGDGGKLGNLGECPPPTGAAGFGAHGQVGRLPSAPTPAQVHPRSRRPGGGPRIRGPGQALPASGPAARSSATAMSF